MGLFNELKSKAKNYSPRTLSDEPVRTIDKNYQPDFSDIEKNREEALRREKESKHQKSQETSVGRTLETIKEHGIKKPKPQAPVVAENPMAKYQVFDDELANADEDFGGHYSTDDTEGTENVVEGTDGIVEDAEDHNETVAENNDAVDTTADTAEGENTTDYTDVSTNAPEFDDSSFFNGDSDGEPLDTTFSFPDATTGNGYDKDSVDDFVQSVMVSVSRNLSEFDAREHEVNGDIGDTDVDTAVKASSGETVEREKYDELLARYEKLHSFVTEQVSEIDMKRHGLNYKPNSIRDALAQHKRSQTRRSQG